jgi:hypothetical protein
MCAYVPLRLCCHTAMVRSNGEESERNGGQRSESCTGRRLAWPVGVYRYMEYGPVDLGVVIILLIGEMHDGNAGLSCEQNSTVCNGSIGNFAMSYRVGDHGAECTVRSKSCAHRRCKRPPFTALEQRLSTCWHVRLQVQSAVGARKRFGEQVYDSEATSLYLQPDWLFASSTQGFDAGQHLQLTVLARARGAAVNM